MKKSILTLLMLPLVIGLASCGEKQHEHSFSTAWSKDASNHWHECSCGEKSDLAAHSGGEATYEHGKICEVCGVEYSEKLVKESIFGRKFTFNGIYSNFVYKEGTTEDTFHKALISIYRDETELRDRIVEELGSLVNKYVVHDLYLDRQIEFGPESVSQEREVNGKKITTYDVNPHEGKKRGEFAVDPENPNQYRFYEVFEENCRVMHILDYAPFSGVSKQVVVEDRGFVLDGKALKINLDVSFSIADISCGATFSITYDDGLAKEVNITKQPQDVHVISPNPFSFSVEVDHPELVTGYQWYAGAFDEFGRDSSWSPIGGSGAKKSTLFVPGTGSKTGKWCYKCLVSTKNREFFSDYATCFVDDAQDMIPTFFVLDYPVRPGDSLDLAKTPYGSGTISYSNSGGDITFDNVHFDNKNIETDLENIAFSLTSWNNTVSKVNFNFVGENVWNNEYWEESHNQGGFGLHMHYARNSVIPEVNFKGDPLTIIGGTRALSIGAKLNIYNDINVVGLPGRLTNGIYAYSICVKKGATVSGSLGGSILYTISSALNPKGYIHIEEGSRVNAIINPGKVAVDDTLLFGIHALEEVIIEHADVSITIVPDYEYFSSTEQMLMPIVGIDSNNSYIQITNSRVDINIHDNKVPETIERLIVNTVMGLNGFEVAIEDSIVNILAKSQTFINVDGVYCILFEAKNSNVTVDVEGNYKVSGITSCMFTKINNFANEDENNKYYNTNVMLGSSYNLGKENTPISEVGYTPLSGNSSDFISKVTIDSCKVLVNTFASTEVTDEFGEIYYIDAGIRAMDFDITLGKNDYVEIHTNKASALVSTFNHFNEIPEEDPVPSHLTLVNDFDCDPASPTLGVTYYTSWTKKEESFFVGCEVLVSEVIGGVQSYVTDLVLRPTNLD